MFQQHTIEIYLILTCIALISLYHLTFYLKIKRHPELTSIGRNNSVRLKWVQTVMEERRDILAVQTLRNWSMAATFLASTAIIISLGSLSIALTTDRLTDASLAFNFIGEQSKKLWAIKLLLISVNFFIAFFNFMLAVRYYNHVPFLITIAPEKDPSITPEVTTQVVNRAAKYNALGMRGYYFSIPLTMWLLGPSWMLIGTVILIILLHYLDKRD